MHNRRGTVAATALAFVLLAAACSRGGDQRAELTPTTAAAGQGAGPTTVPGPTTTTTEPPQTVPPAATSPTCPPTPARNQPDVNRPRYTLTIDVNLDENVVRGTTEVRFTPDLDTDQLVFRLWGNAPRPLQGGGSITTGDVTLDGRPANATQTDPTTLVVGKGTSPSFKAGRAVGVKVPWVLRLPGSSNDRISRDGDALRLGSFFPILAWEPGVGWATEPATGAFAEASTAPVADFDVTITVPAGLTVLASGGEDRPGHWMATAMRDFALSVGRFTVATGTANAPDPVQVTVGVHQGLGESPNAYLAKAIDVLTRFGTEFGPYPWPTYTLAITPNLGGGIEYPSHVMQGPGTNGSTTPHEIGHMWFYGLVGNDQGRDPWLDEGLASWAEGRYEGTLGQFAATAMPSGAAGRMGEPMSYWSSQPSIYYRGVYVQGVQALNALGKADAVDCALRTYVAVFAHRIARPADLVAALRASFPNAATVMAGYGVRT